MQDYFRFLVAAVGLAWGGAGHAQSAPTDESTFESLSGATQQGRDFEGVSLAPRVEPHLVAPAIPEPETYALMAAGIALLGLRARRKSPR